MKTPKIGDTVRLKADGEVHTVTSVIKSDVFPSGYGVECDGDGYQGVFAATKRRTGYYDLSQFEPLPDGPATTGKPTPSKKGFSFVSSIPLAKPDDPIFKRGLLIGGKILRPSQDTKPQESSVPPEKRN